MFSSPFRWRRMPSAGRRLPAGRKAPGPRVTKHRAPDWNRLPREGVKLPEDFPNAVLCGAAVFLAVRRSGRSHSKIESLRAADARAGLVTVCDILRPSRRADMRGLLATARTTKSKTLECDFGNTRPGRLACLRGIHEASRTFRRSTSAERFATCDACVRRSLPTDRREWTDESLAPPDVMSVGRARLDGGVTPRVLTSQVNRVSARLKFEEKRK